MSKPKVDVKRLEVWVADLGRQEGSVQGGVRPICILQNDVGNKYAPTVAVAPMTTSKTKKKLPTHVNLKASEVGLEDDSILLVEQLGTISKERLMFKVAEIPESVAWLIDRACKIQLGLTFH
ncbi:type II toxin-antitoxin system PemK/MazF family toxin [Paenibacillus lautus]|uniref:type II toxin-antitoxin system PemK/MazF family toxin n=1 Tax=Paenibacillus lautus TaxID=1401 RepID=UPI001C7CC3B9|nr:type II toxin-antitoxin system PemK/MazF family toxin [Paenibacillus lautus]MBX4152291.1 type II toxin-antitoxin system PemK/MazF family toxin [Paenibacillus lautus]